MMYHLQLAKMVGIEILAKFSEVYYVLNSHAPVAHFLGLRQLECQL